MPIVITSDGGVSINRFLRKSIDGILHKYNIANWRLSTDCSHCFTGLFKSSRLVLLMPSPDDDIVAGSEICKRDRDHQSIKIVTIPILCNACVQLN